MKIEDDIKRIAESLLDIPLTNNKIVTEIHSVNFTSRHPNSPYYQNPHSVQRMIDGGVLKLIEQGEDAQPALNASAIHYFANYKVSFIPNNLSDYLLRLESLSSEEKTGELKKEIYQWNDLTLDLLKFTLRYKDNSPFSISLTREVKLLRMLMHKPQNIVYYLEVAKEVGIDTGDEEIKPGLVDKSIAQDVQKVRQDLIDNFLIPSGMPEKEARSIIVNVRNSGYKLG